MNTDKVVDKVRKLLNLANNAGATEGERDNALRQAHAFLAKYNLDMSLVEGTDGKEQRGDLVVQYPNNPNNRTISNAVAALFFCKYLYFKGSNKHVFIGLESNAITASEIALWIINTAGKEARRHPDYMEYGAQFITAFMRGVADTIYRRCMEIIEAQKKQQPSQPGTSLVLADVYKTEFDLNIEYMNSRFGKASAGKHRKRNETHASGYSAGVQHGKTVNLNTQLANK